MWNSEGKQISEKQCVLFLGFWVLVFGEEIFCNSIKLQNSCTMPTYCLIVLKVGGVQMKNYFAIVLWNKVFFAQSCKVKKLPPIQSDSGPQISFDDRCNAFIKAMYPKPPEVDLSQEADIASRLEPWTEKLCYQEMRASSMSKSGLVVAWLCDQPDS